MKPPYLLVKNWALHAATDLWGEVATAGTGPAYACGWRFGPQEDSAKNRDQVATPAQLAED